MSKTMSLKAFHCQKDKIFNLSVFVSLCSPVPVFLLETRRGRPLKIKAPFHLKCCLGFSHIFEHSVIQEYKFEFPICIFIFTHIEHMHRISHNRILKQNCPNHTEITECCISCQIARKCIFLFSQGDCFGESKGKRL